MRNLRPRLRPHYQPRPVLAPIPIPISSNPYFGSVEVQEDGGGLVLAADPRPQLYPLQPWDGAVMVFDFVTENAPVGSRSTLTFSDTASGSAQSLEVELFTDDEPVRFTRV